MGALKKLKKMKTTDKLVLGGGALLAWVFWREHKAVQLQLQRQTGRVEGMSQGHGRGRGPCGCR